MNVLKAALAATCVFTAFNAYADQNIGAPDALRDANCKVDDESLGMPTSNALACLSLLAVRQMEIDKALDAARSTGGNLVSLEDAKRINSYAVTAFQAYLTARAKVDENYVAQTDARNRSESLHRIAANLPTNDSKPLIEIADNEQKKADQLVADSKQLVDSSDKLLPVAKKYTDTSLKLQFAQSSTDLGNQDRRPQSSDCARMIDRPDVSLRVGSCKAGALAALPGGNLQVPGSILNPRGFSALLTGSDDAGALNLTYSREFKRRAPLATEGGQRFYRWGFSGGIASGSASLFASDLDKQFIDRFDSTISIKGSIFANSFRRQRQYEWTGFANDLAKEALTACLKDQASPDPSFHSTCQGQSLTDWVFASAKKGNGLLHSDLAGKADALYWGKEDAKPLYGFGLEGRISRPYAEVLSQTDFDQNFKGVFDRDFTEAFVNKSRRIAWALTPYAHIRATREISKIDVVFIGSTGFGRTFEYPKGTEKVLYCPPVDTSVGFSTNGCKSYYPKLPDYVFTITPSLETRIITYGNGRWPTFAVSPKVSYAMVEETPAGDLDRWTISVPVLVFVGDDLKTGLGVQYQHEFGGTKLSGDNSTFISNRAVNRFSLVVSKTFSLSGR